MESQGVRDSSSRWPTVALVAIFVLAALWTLWFAAKVTEPFVWPDELTYTREALHIWDIHRFLLPSDPSFNSWAQLQPLLMAPLWGLLETQDAYHATHVLNSLLLASTAFPAYLLTRRVTGSRPASLGVAAIAVLTPWVTLAGTMMTEVVAYPVFAWTLLALQHAIARPSRRADLVALAMLALAFFTRPQFVALAPAFVIALAVQELRFRDESAGQALRRHAFVIAAVVAGLVVVLAAGGGSQNLFGNYAQTASGGLFPNGTFTQAVEGLAYVAVAIAIVPVALSLAFAFGELARPREREQHAYALLLLAMLLFLGYANGVFSAQFTAGVQDRYFYFLVVPLLTGTAAWVLQRRPSVVALGAGTLIAAWLVWRAALSLRSPSLVSPSSAWHAVVFGKVAELDHRLGTHWLTAQRLMAAVTIAACAALFAVRRLRPQWRWLGVVVLASIGVYTAVETRYTMTHIAMHQAKRDAANWAALDWVDDLVGDGAASPAVLSDMGSPPDAEAIWWDTRFWNKSAAPALTVDEANLAQGIIQSAVLDRERGRIPELVRARFAIQALPDRRFQLQGAKSLGTLNSVQVLRLPGTGRLDWTLDAQSDNGLVPVRRPATLRVYRSQSGAPQRVTVSFTTNFQTAGDYHYRIAGAGVRRAGLVKVGKSKSETFDVRAPAGGYSTVRLSATGPVNPSYPLGGLLITDLHSAPAS